ncbi:MAG: phosphate acetyltransferase [Pontiellaceae bacterium]|jgi:phosphate acetyltransferase|nr:phosphate acetyltransferase [Pontiellaceae bacterium]
MSRSEFIQTVIRKAQANQRTIVLPEGADARVIAAANQIAAEGIAGVIVLGDEKTAAQVSSGVTVINPLTSDKLEGYAATFCELRRGKGITLEQAREAVRHVNYFGMMMVQNGEADGLVSGAAHSTADTVRPALQIIKSAEKGSIISSVFFMCVNDVPYIFSDCGLVENPDAAQLAQIAVQSAKTALQFGIPANVALLSYSTKGSASSPLVDKVIEATGKAKELLKVSLPDAPVKLDGELQVDAAIVPGVAKSKAPQSELAGQARVLIFPDLNAGNMAYKLVQRLGGAEAYGPVLQGLKKPVNDLSRGCSAEDIVGVVAITAVQSL